MSNLHRVVIYILVLVGYLSVNFGSYGGSLTMYFLDIGQGDSILIVSPGGRRILIDGGPYQSIVSELDRVTPVWDRQLDLVMASHADDDHISGLVSVVERYKVGRLLMNQTSKKIPSVVALLSELDEQSIGRDAFYKGQIMTIEPGLQLRGLWPDAKQTLGSTENDLSQVVVLEFGHFTALMTGDAESSVLNQALSDQVLGFDLLKVPHHGSAGGLNDDLLQKMSPNVAIISSGLGNRYGHPHPETLQLLEDNGTQIYRTDLQGTLRVVVDGSGFSVYSEKTLYNR